MIKVILIRVIIILTKVIDILTKVIDIVPVSVLMLWLVLRVKYQWILIVIIRVHYFRLFVYWSTNCDWFVQIVIIVVVVVVNVIVVDERFVYSRG